jgi:hypothetical protein
LTNLTAIMVGCAHRLHEKGIGIHEVSYKSYGGAGFIGSEFSPAADQKNGRSNRMTNDEGWNRCALSF